MNDIVEKFTTHLRSVIVRSLSLAEEKLSPSVEITHILWSLATERGSLGAEILQKTKLNPEDILKKLETKKGKKENHSMREFSKEAKRILEKAVLSASAHDHSYVGTEHLLSAIAQSENEISAAAPVSESDIRLIKRELEIVLKTTSKFPDMTAEFRDPKERARVGAIKDGK